MTHHAGRGLATTAGLHQRLALGDAALRHIGDKASDRIAIDHRLLVVRHLDDAVAERLAAAGGMNEPLVAGSDEALRHCVGLYHLDPRPWFERGEIVGSFL